MISEMSFVIAIAIMMFLMFGGFAFGALAFAPHWYKTNRAKGIHLVCCFVVFAVGVVMFVTMLNSPVDTVNVEDNAYNIEKMTSNTVRYIKNDEEVFIYFNDDYTYSVEQATDQYENVVVEEKTHYVRHWWWELNYTPVKYIVYLDNDAWEKYQSNGVIIDNSLEVNS